MTRGRPIPPDRSAQNRRFTILARLWVVALVVLAAAFEYRGEFTVALGIIAAGLVGFLVVFDPGRSWWGHGPQATTATRRQWPANRRHTVALVGLLVFVATVTSIVTLTWQG